MENKMKHIGNLEIRTAADAKKYADLTEVTGHMYINSSAKLDAPALTGVGGYLYINSSAKLDAPALTGVGGDLSINKEASLIAGKLYTGGYSKFKVYDNIGCVILSEKSKDGVKILSCRHSKIKNQKVIGDKFYVAQIGEYTAHGKTIQDALNELQLKTGVRDIEQYRSMDPKTRKSPADWAFVYRMVTGACQYGTQDFMARKGKLKATYTLTEILRETKGVYGHEKFAEVVK